jgi:hypothetical protein
VVGGEDPAATLQRVADQGLGLVRFLFFPEHGPEPVGRLEGDRVVGPKGAPARPEGLAEQGFGLGRPAGQIEQDGQLIRDAERGRGLRPVKLGP